MNHVALLLQLFVVVCALVFDLYCATADAFLMTMSSSSSSSSSRSAKNILQRGADMLPKPPLLPMENISSALISQLAVVAIKSRLKSRESTVSCDVAFSSSELLLRGRVGPVTVKGSSWKSGLGLTCRRIEANVDQCELNTKRLLQDQKLSLIEPAKGKAMVALNSEDFGNFIVHPLLKPPVINDNNNAVVFVNDKSDPTIVDAEANAVIFFIDYDDKRWKCSLQRSSDEKQRAVVEVKPVLSEASSDASAMTSPCQILSDSLNSFFNELVFELDGTLKI